MQWRRKSGVKITDLCKYVDAHSQELKDCEEDGELENNIYNAIWLIIRAIAQKKGMFRNYQDYDDFSFYAATKMFFTMKRCLEHEGELSRMGKRICHIRSVLNYVKSMLFVWRIAYNQETFRQVFSDGGKGSSDTSVSQYYRDGVEGSQNMGAIYKSYVVSSMNPRSLNEMLERTLEVSPFKKGSIEYKHTKMSVALSAIQLLSRQGDLPLDGRKHPVAVYGSADRNYVEIFLISFIENLKKEIKECGKYSYVSDDVVDNISKDAYIQAYKEMER